MRIFFLVNICIFINTTAAHHHRQQIRRHWQTPCATSPHCIAGSICQWHLCQCVAGSAVVGGQCAVVSISVSTAAPGQQCSNDVLCGGGSSCQNGRCVCPSGCTVQNNQCQFLGYQPLPARFLYANPGQICAADISCIGGSYCWLGICVCAPLAMIVNNQCVIVQQPFPISTTAQPVPDVVSNQLAYPGQSCTDSQLCLAGSNCLMNVCSCSSGSVLQNNRCVMMMTNAFPVLPDQVPPETSTVVAVVVGNQTSWSVATSNSSTVVSSTTSVYHGNLTSRASIESTETKNLAETTAINETAALSTAAAGQLLNQTMVITIVPILNQTTVENVLPIGNISKSELPSTESSLSGWWSTVTAVPFEELVKMNTMLTTTTTLPLLETTDRFVGNASLLKKLQMFLPQIRIQYPQAASNNNNNNGWRARIIELPINFKQRALLAKRNIMQQLNQYN